MPQLKPRILFLSCGGTIAMHKHAATGALVNGGSPSDFLAMAPELESLAAISVINVANVDSADFTPRHWEALGETIAREFNSFDGFVVTMGTNTLAYAASALSFSLLGIGKPVIFTGSQIAAESVYSDARVNLTNSVRVATLDLAGVYVVFGSKIIRGTRAKKVSESEIDAFATFQAPDFGKIGIQIVWNGDCPLRHSRPLILQNGFEDGVVCVTLIPGLHAEYVQSLLDSGVRGLILRSYGSGDISSNIIPVLLSAQSSKIPVVVTTQCPRESTMMGIDDLGLQSLYAGAIQAFDMSMETMSTKLMWLLNQKVPYEALRTRMHESLTGEVDPMRAALFLNDELRHIYKTLQT